MKNIKTLINENVLSTQEQEMIKNYYTSTKVDDVILNISTLPGCGIINFLVTLGELENIEVINLHTPMFDKNDDIRNMLVVNRSEKLILILDDFHRLAADVLINTLDFINTLNNPNVKIITTSRNILGSEDFDISKYGDVIASTNALTLLTLI